MSASAGAIHELPHHSRPAWADPLRVRALDWAVVVPVCLYLAVSVAADSRAIRTQVPELLIWLVPVAVTDLLPVRVWKDVVLTMSVPILLAAGMVFEPHIAGVVAFLGSSDIREFRREIGVSRTLFNRSQVALSVVSGSFVFHAFGGSVAEWPMVLAMAAAAYATDFSVNALLVATRTAVRTRRTPWEVFLGIVGDSPLQNAAEHVCFGLAAALIGTVYVAEGTWGLAAFVVPVLLSRQMFAHGRRLSDAERVIEQKNQTIVSVSRQIEDERREERLTVAAGLHDEVLPPLYQVHLMGQVLRQELASGRLLELEEDLPSLLLATEYASEAMRSLIRDLRKSSLGPSGLAGTLELLVRSVQAESNVGVRLEVADVRGLPLVELLAYQVAREALRNAVRHASASNILVSVSGEKGLMRVTVRDDGIGFERSMVDEESHFGLQLMRDRTESVGGTFHVASSPDRGTLVVATFPAE